MENILENFHSKEYINKSLTDIKTILTGLYGKARGLDNYNYITAVVGKYLKSLSKDDIKDYASFNSSMPYDHLKGKIFAISYPDNIYNDSDPTLQTLGSVLGKYFPSINGIHILPERVMSHGDVWPQDFFAFMPKENALELVLNLQKSGILDEDRYITSKYAEVSTSFITSLPEKAVAVLHKAFNSHFNDGGFSQATRSTVDPRFGTVKDIKDLTKNYSVMLDYVVNHVDIDSDVLELYRKGADSGDAFIIISPSEYGAMKEDGSLYKTFRPRPFPLYTGMRRYPEIDKKMNSIFLEKGMPALDERVVKFLSISFKVENDQGLTAEDKRTFDAFRVWLSENSIDENLLFKDSSLQENQKLFLPELIGNMGKLLQAICIDSSYADIFQSSDDEIFGEKFFIYTTFSESQADINPLSSDGFKMIIDDLYYLLSSGKLSMMRMDAIKYLWKEKGRKNFDMHEGNKFIELIRKLMALTAPSVLPLDEVNSPDPVVYKMEEDGGFAYLFGPVNSTVAAFNEGTLQPLKSYYELYRRLVPKNFVPFVMLSTHDGRSVQGLGVQRTDGHVSIKQFYSLKNGIEKQGGQAKYRSVAVGEVSADTFNKVISEAKLIKYKDQLLEIFTSDSVAEGNTYILNKDMLIGDNLIKKISRKSGFEPGILITIPAIDYFLKWILEGKTIYELCATTRSSLKLNDGSGMEINPVLEALRLALAEGFALTVGQSVPAIYFNDLLGMKNDQHGYEISGKPRDLNRHKSYLPDMNLSNPSNPFTKAYLPLINKIIELRTGDGAFYPGSSDFEFVALTDTVFLNHPYHKGEHSLILGNISGKPVSFRFSLETLSGMDKGWLDMKNNSFFTDGITGAKIEINEEGGLNLELPAYGMMWLKQ